MIARTIKTQLVNNTKTYPVTLVTGARQIGKSTLCYELAKEYNYNYVSLDDLDNRSEALNDPKFFLAKHKSPLIIDEVQYAPILFEYIEAIVNKKRMETGDANGMYILIESQKFKLMKNVTESMAGRVGIVNMSPLSYNETISREEIPFKMDLEVLFKRVNHDISSDHIFELITKGFYPELYRNPNLNANSFYSNYISTYIDKDVTDIINIKNKLSFHKLMQLLASLTGEELIYDNLAKQIGVDKKTIVNWISVLEASNIIYLLQPYYETSLTKRVIKRPKIYFKDTGLACHLAKLADPKNLAVSHFSGHFVETYVINEIIKSYENTGTYAEFYYYRDNEQNEIDLIIQANGNLTLIEIKSGMNYSNNNIKGFKALENTKYKIGTSCVICLNDSIYKINDNVYALPISVI